MKSKIPMIVALALLALSTFSPQLSTCFAQGSLTPPGPPGPTMTSLSQVMTTLNQNEPRTPISSAPFTITQPGSYYLTTNLNVANGDDAIEINTNGVTLDLNGFTISSTGAYGTAILLHIYNPFNIGNSDITISNGHITGGVTNKSGVYGGPGFAIGISFLQPPPMWPYNVRVTGVSVSGCLNNGISLGTGNSTVVESCTVNNIGGIGIEASSVSHSTAVQCGDTAIFADTASDCYGYCTGYGDGLYAGTANNCSGGSAGSGSGIYVDLANNCSGASGSGPGIYAGRSATSCTGQSSSGDGLDVGEVANNCYGTSTSGTGLSASIATSCWGTSQSTTGLSASQIAIGCYGVSSSSTGLSAPIANSCAGSGTPAYTVTHPYNMP